MSGCCALACFKPANNACSWLFSWWVAVVPWCVSSLLTMPVLDSPACGWLLCLAVFQACWQCLFLALQYVSGCYALLCFKPADNAYSGFSREWVVAVPYCDPSLLTMLVLGSPVSEWLLCIAVSSLLTMPVLGSLACEWLLCLGVFQASWQCLFLTVQFVSGCCALMCFHVC